MYFLQGTRGRVTENKGYQIKTTNTEKNGVRDVLCEWAQSKLPQAQDKRVTHYFLVLQQPSEPALIRLPLFHMKKYKDYTIPCSNRQAHLNGILILQAFRQMVPLQLLAGRCLLRWALPMAGRWWWGVHAHSWHAWWVSLAELLCTLSLYQQHDGGGGCGKQRYCLIMPGFCHVYPIDLEQPANSVSDHHTSTPCHFKPLGKHPKGPQFCENLPLPRSLYPKHSVTYPTSSYLAKGHGHLLIPSWPPSSFQTDYQPLSPSPPNLQAPSPSVRLQRTTNTKSDDAVPPGVLQSYCQDYALVHSLSGKYLRLLFGFAFQLSYLAMTKETQ